MSEDILAGIVTERAKDAKTPTKWIQWDDDSPFFCIEPLTEETSDAARERSKDPKKPMKTERRMGFRPKKVPNINDDIFAKELFKEILKGWKGFQLRHLKDVVDPAKYQITLDGADPNTPIPFNEEWLGRITQWSTVWFRNFITGEATDMADFHAEQREEQEENSEGTSVGT